jgi:hypothetical protein
MGQVVQQPKLREEIEMQLAICAASAGNLEVTSIWLEGRACTFKLAQRPMLEWACWLDESGQMYLTQDVWTAPKRIA